MSIPIRIAILGYKSRMRKEHYIARAFFALCTHGGAVMAPAPMCPDLRFRRLVRRTSPAGRTNPINCKRRNTNRFIRQVIENAGMSGSIPPMLRLLAEVYREIWPRRRPRWSKSCLMRYGMRPATDPI